MGNTRAYLSVEGKGQKGNRRPSSWTWPIPGKECSMCDGGKWESHLTAAAFALKSELRFSAESKREGLG